MADMSAVPPPYFDPSQQPAWLDMERKQQLAQMLMGAFQQSNQTPPEWNSMKVVPRRGLLQNISALATALGAAKTQNSAYDSQNKYFQGLYGGGQQPSSTQGAPTGPGPGIVDPNAPPDQQSAADQVGQTPGIVRQGASSMLPPGMTPQQANMMMSLPGGGPEMTKAIMARFMPLDIQRQLSAAGIDPSSPQGRDLIARTVQKGATNVQDVRPGGTLFDMNAGAPLFSAPQNGVQTTWNNGQPSQAVVAGAAPAAQTVAQAETTGKTLGSVVNVPQKGGGTVPALGADYFKQPAAGTRPAAATPASPPSAAAPGKSDAAYWSGLPTYKTPTGAGAQSTESAKTADLIPVVRAENYKKFGQIAQDAAEQERNDVMALRSLGNATVGGEADRVNATKGALVTFGLLSDKQADKLTSSTELGKYLNNNALANARQKFGGGRLTNTDVSLSIEKLNPGTNMTDKAIYNLTTENMIRSAYAKQMTADFTHADKNLAADPQAFEQWYSQHHPLNDFANQNGKAIAQQALQEWKGGASAVTNPTAHSPADLAAEMRRRGLLK